MAKRVRKGKLAPGTLHAKIAFDEAKHKRGMGGKFADKPGAGNDAPKKTHHSQPLGQAMLAKGKTSGIKPGDKIFVHVHNNPKKAGSASAADFAKYKDGMTVAEFKAAVGPKALAHVNHDLKQGFISVHDPLTLPKPKVELSKQQYINSGKTTAIKGSDVIKLHPQDKVVATGAADNVKKPGSKSAADFAKYKDEMTVDEFVAAVGDKKAALAHIAHDKSKGFISVHEKGSLTDLRTGKTQAGFGTPKPGVTDVKTLKQDDVLTTSQDVNGIEMTVGQWHKTNMSASGKTIAASAADMQKSLNDGVWQLKAPGTTSTGAKIDLSKLDENTLLESSFSGKQMSVKDYLAAHGADKAVGLKALQSSVDAGNWKIPPGSPLKEAKGVLLAPGQKVEKPSVDALKDNDVIHLKTQANPFKAPASGTTLNSSSPYGSDLLHVKFKALELKGGKMTYAQYKATAAGTLSAKDAALQKMIDDDHVKIASAAQVASVAKVHTQAQSQGWISATPTAAAKKSVEWQSDDPRWSKAGGVRNLTADARQNETARQVLIKEADANGIGYNSTHPAIVSYTGNGYHAINDALRAGKPSTRGAQIRALIDASPPLARDTYFYRGYGSGSGLNDIPPPGDFVDRGFTSVSYNPRVSMGFGGHASSGKEQINAALHTLFRIRAPKGVKMMGTSIGQRSRNSGLGSEAEVLVQAGTRYRFVKSELVDHPDSIPLPGEPGKFKKIRMVELEILRADGTPFPS